MKISKNFFEKLLIIILLASSTRFFYITPLPKFFLQESSNVMCGAFFSVVIFVLFILLNKQLQLGKYGIEIWILYIIVLVNCVYMYVTYKYTITNLFYCIVPFLILLGYFPIIQFAENRSNYFFLLKTIEVIALILSIILLLQKYKYDTNNDIFLKINLPLNFTGRFYNVSEGIIRIAIIISAYQIISRNIRLLSLINLVFCALSIFLVDQSRIYLLSVIIGIFVMIIMNIVYSGKKSNVIIYILLVAIGLFLIYSLYTSLTTTLNNFNDGSNYARRDAVTYYLAVIKDHLWTGLGLYVPNIGEAYSDFIKGPLGIYNYSDIGILGILASLGLGAVIWYIWCLIKGLILALKASDKVLCLGLISEMFVSMFTMTYFDSSRQCSLMLVLALLSINSYAVQNNVSAKNH
ncbi:MAG: O-antigen ligase family protein [Mollicutes bacterium]|nr:O-antigen ligase family protein [Mollicutes bacterium]